MAAALRGEEEEKSRGKKRQDSRGQKYTSHFPMIGISLLPINVISR
jgi:hypothetical protein